jgi:hypothetical protein
MKNRIRKERRGESSPHGADDIADRVRFKARAVRA